MRVETEGSAVWIALKWLPTSLLSIPFYRTIVAYIRPADLHIGPVFGDHIEILLGYCRFTQLVRSASEGIGIGIGLLPTPHW